jgi:hypothetical protein
VTALSLLTTDGQATEGEGDSGRDRAGKRAGHHAVIFWPYDANSSDYSSKGVDLARNDLRAFFCD